MQDACGHPVAPPPCPAQVVLSRPVAPRIADGRQAQLRVGGLLRGGAALGQGGAVERHDVGVAKVAARQGGRARSGRSAPDASAHQPGHAKPQDSSLADMLGRERARCTACWAAPPPLLGPPVNQVAPRHVGHRHVAVVLPAARPGMRSTCQVCSRCCRAASTAAVACNAGDDGHAGSRSMSRSHGIRVRGV